jgi:hypothetical protein
LGGHEGDAGAERGTVDICQDEDGELLRLAGAGEALRLGALGDTVAGCLGDGGRNAAYVSFEAGGGELYSHGGAVGDEGHRADVKGQSGGGTGR